jgi:hypothetical protein
MFLNHFSIFSISCVLFVKIMLKVILINWKSIGLLFLFLYKNCIASVKDSLLALSAVYGWLDPWLGQTKDCKIGVYCFSAKHPALRSKRLIGPQSG